MGCDGGTMTAIAPKVTSRLTIPKRGNEHTSSVTAVGSHFRKLSSSVAVERHLMPSELLSEIIAANRTNDGALS
jgi:hypothetical protein